MDIWQIFIERLFFYQFPSLLSEPTYNPKIHQKCINSSIKQWVNHINKIILKPDYFKNFVTNPSKINGTWIIKLLTKVQVTGEVIKNSRTKAKTYLDWLYCHAAQILQGRRECKWTRLSSHTKTLLHT